MSGPGNRVILLSERIYNARANVFFDNPSRDLPGSSAMMVLLSAATGFCEMEDSPVVELGDLTCAKTAGHSSELQVTVCDLTGMGVQDTAIATVAYEAALSRGIGTMINN